MGAVDYYSLLGVSRNATQEAIKRAFRKKIIEIHPDVHPDQALASEMTREIVEAYKTLINPARRALYNASLARIAEELVIYQEPVNYHCAI